MPDSNSPQNDRPPVQSRVAEIVTGFSLLGITVISTVVLAKSWGDPEKGQETVRYVFASILPLLGSWMGTILAFYFSRDNLAAATQSVKDLTQAVTGAEKLKTLPVKGTMRALKDMKFETVDPADDDKKKLSDLLQKGVERIPILNGQSAIRYLIYRAMIDRYLAQFTQGKSLPTGKQAGDLTLKDLVDSDPATKKIFESTMAFVPVTATLADAKSAMEKIEKCSDVFVTNAGNKDEPILGWVTDNTIIENSRA